MIISHRWRFVFVKTRKTAGTSVELALAAVCGPDDVITPLTDADEHRRRELGLPGPQHFHAPLRAWSPATIRTGLRWRMRPMLFNHGSASQARRVLGPRRWREYTTFTVERNPWDRAVSRYYWISRHREDPPTFSQFLRDESPSQWHLYGTRRGLLVDRVLRFEALGDDLGALWADLGLPGTPDLPHTKSSARPAATRDHRGMYSPEDRAYVAAACWREIERFGYTF